MNERYGVRVGQRVRDLDGDDLGKVTRLYADGFEITKGFPILFRQDFVARYDEVRGVRDGALVLARSKRDLFDLATGEIPPAWRIAAPPEYPAAATPSEARLVFADLASGAIATERPAAMPAMPATPPSAAPAPAGEGEYQRDRREAVGAPPMHS